jgi:ribonuclease Z
MIEVVFLGVGAALPMRGQTNCAYLVRAGDLTLLFDCGPAILQQLAAVGRDPGDLTHVFVSHCHGDHTLGYPMLLLWWGLERPPDRPWLTFIAGDVTWPSLDALRENTYRDVTAKAAAAPRLSFPTREPAVLQIGGATLRTWPMKHSDFAPVSGLRLEVGDKVIAFTADTEPCDGILPLARGADLLVHDAAYSATLHPETADGLFGHSSARSAGRHAAEAGAKRLALVHLHARYEGKQDLFVEEAAREFTGSVSVPRAGDVVVLD